MGFLTINYRDIYPHSLKLNKENTEDSEASFFALSVKIQNQVFHTSLYDKQDAFSFDIVNFPNLSGNIPKKTYPVVIAQVLRYANACMDYSHCVGHSKTLITKLRNQFYSGNILRRTFRTFCMKYKEKLQKFDISIGRITEDRFSQ